MRTTICMKKRKTVTSDLLDVQPLVCVYVNCEACSSLQWNVVCSNQLILGASYCKDVPVPEIFPTFLSLVRTVVTIFCVMCFLLMPWNKAPLVTLLLERDYANEAIRSDN